jgi:hypothetical protein
VTQHTLERSRALAIVLLGLLPLDACHSSGSGSGSPALTIRLSTDADAWGVVIRVPGEAAAATNSTTPAASCTVASAALRDACSASSTVTPGGGLDLQLRGCRLRDGDDLFTCTLPDATRERLKTSAVVQAGCGCADTCPRAVAIQVCSDAASPATCEVATVALAPRKAARTREVTAQSTTTTAASGSTDATVCPTCCEIDWAEDISGHTTSDTALSEIRFDIPFYGGDGCHNWDCSIPVGPRASIRRDGSVVHVCVSADDPFGLQRTDSILDCKDIALDFGSARVTRATDLNLAPVDPLPGLKFQ